MMALVGGLLVGLWCGVTSGAWIGRRRGAQEERERLQLRILDSDRTRGLVAIPFGRLPDGSWVASRNARN